MVGGVVNEGAKLRLQLTVPAHLRFDLLVEIDTTLINTHGRRSRHLRHLSAQIGISDADWLLERALAAAVLLI